MKYVLFIFIVLLFSCSSKFEIIRITSSEKYIVDSCNNYLKYIPSLNNWDKEIVSYDNKKVNQYFYLFPIEKKGKVKEYYTIISKPYYSIMGRDSILNGEIQYLTIIKKDKGQ